MNYQDNGSNNHNSNGFNTINNGMPQNGPVNPYMNPMMQLNPQAYEQAIAFRQQLIQQQKEYFQKLIKERYPVKFAIATSAIMIIICLIEIAMQIIIIVNKAPYYYIGGGIWAGLAGIGLAGLTLATAKKLSLDWFRATQILSPLVAVIFFVGFCIVSIIGIVNFGSSCLNQNCPEKDTSSRPFHYVMISFGVASVFLVWFMLIFIICKLKLRYPVGNQARAGYHQPNNGLQMGQINGMNKQMNTV